MSRERFHDLLEKYQDGRCTEAERAIVEQWYALLDSGEPDQQEEELNMLEQKLWLRIHAQSTSQSHTRKLWLQRHPINAMLSLAACLCIGLFVTLFVNRNQTPLQASFIASRSTKLKRLHNDSSRPYLLRLQDGSQVLLDPQASLTYPMHFEKELREVSLSGDGFFTISKDPSRPFLVYSKDVVTRVVGTSFSVKVSPVSKRSEVTVKTGKVIVRPTNPAQESGLGTFFSKAELVTLVPNQKTIYDPNTAVFRTTLADNPVLVKKAGVVGSTPEFKYNEASVEAVVEDLKRAYDIHISVLDVELNSNTFTGDLSSMNMYNKLDFLCESIDASYHLVGTRIYVQKK
jgi:transmembrane sensor